ncbi:nucleotide-diphospho-sugar transferase [Kalaharituber pfeilii]|nr:nucleotide-diphospho-sugar transferase [Kalaharituber pfeilii]
MARPRLFIVLCCTLLLLAALYHGAYVYRDRFPSDATSAPHPTAGSESKEPAPNSPKTTGTPTILDTQPEKPPEMQPEAPPDTPVDTSGEVDSQKIADEEAGKSGSHPTTSASAPASPTSNPNDLLTLLDGDLGKSIDWTRFAYLQYVTESERLCNSVMLFESLHRVQSRAQRVLMYPSTWGAPGSDDWKKLPAQDRENLEKARDQYKVILEPVSIIVKKGKESTWEASFTKLLAFNQTQYSRVIMCDNDATLLKHLDHLFLLPPTPLAIPRAYWLMPDPPLTPSHTIPSVQLSSQLLVVTPNTRVFNRMMEAVQDKGENDYDMEIINWVLGDEAIVLPHRGLNLVSGEFKKNHRPGTTMAYDKYLGLGGPEGEVWDPKKVLEEARYVHFSDWPRPKPWFESPPKALEKETPKCYPKSTGGRLVRREQDMDCSDRDAWLWLYSDFKDRRKAVCGLDLLPAPQE